eukprot:2473969-Rhodomonas_salina.2
MDKAQHTMPPSQAERSWFQYFKGEGSWIRRRIMDKAQYTMTLSQAEGSWIKCSKVEESWIRRTTPCRRVRLRDHGLE